MAAPPTATVTLLFCDLVDSTALAAELGAAADDLRHEVFDALRAEVTAFRGTEVKSLGDGLMVSFGGNADAVRAAAGMQQKIEGLGRARQLPLALRIGISVGEATFEDNDWFGTPVVEASRLCSAASAGQVLIADVVRALLGGRSEVPLRPVGELDLKGLPNPIAACEVEWAPIAADAARLPLPRAFSIAPRFSLAGRDAQVDQLTAEWKQVVSGGCRAVLISGEPGVGKTRLAGELGRAVESDGGFVLFGRCDEGLGVPYQPFVEALSHVIAHASVDILPELVGPTAGELCRVVPELQLRRPELSPTSSDPETERYLLFEAMAGWLEAQSQLAPTLLVLDDLHWAAEPTLRLLRHVLRAERDFNLLVLGTYRDTEIDRTHPLGALLADLRRGEGVNRMALHGLDEDGVADLVQRASGQELNDQARDLARAVHAETAGNPFFAIEVLVSLAERRAIYQDAGGVWRSDVSIEELGIPEGVKEVVGQRLSALPEASDASLHAAAVVGQEFELDVIARITDASEDQLVDSLDAARAAGLLDELGGRPLRYRFAHALVQQTLLEELPTARRLRFHRSIAEAIEELRADRLDQYRPALARHWYEAGTEPKRALDAATAAAEGALAQFADREALQWLAQAQDLVSDANAPDTTRIDVMIMTGEALRRIGDASHREVLLEAGRLAGRTGDSARMARAALANGRGWQSDIAGIDADRVAALEAALAELGEGDPNTRALLLVRLAVESLYEPNPAHRLALAEEALATARANNDPFTVATVLSTRHNILLSHDTIEQRRLDAEELSRLSEQLGDPNLAGFSHTAGLFWRVQTRDLAGARADVRRASEIYQTLAQPVGQWIASWMEAGLAVLDGRLDQADELLERTLEIGMRGGIPDAPVFDASMRLGLLMYRGDPGSLNEARELSERLPEHYPGGLAWRILIELLAGQTETADELVDKLGRSPYAPWSEAGGPPDSALGYAGWYAAAEAALGKRSKWTQRAYEYLEPCPGQLFGNLIWFGPPEAFMAGVAPLVGRADELDRLMENALAVNDETPMPLNAMLDRLLMACGLRLRDRPGDRERAGRVVDEAIQIGDRVGAGLARSAAEHFPSLAV